MTQVLSVSANTAAYASEATKPIVKPPRSTDVEIAIDELARKAVTSDDERLKAILNVVRPPALQIYFLTAGKNTNPQATLEQAREAYAGNQPPLEVAPAPTPTPAPQMPAEIAPAPALASGDAP